MVPTKLLFLKKLEMSLQAVAMKFAAFHTVASTVQPAVATSLLEWMVPCPKRLSEPNSAKTDQPDVIASLPHAVAAQPTAAPTAAPAAAEQPLATGAEPTEDAGLSAAARHPLAG